MVILFAVEIFINYAFRYLLWSFLKKLCKLCDETRRLLIFRFILLCCWWFCFLTMTLLCLHRDGHHRASHVSKSIPASPSRHGTVPSRSSGMIGKPGVPHHKHKHPHPMFPGTVRVTQAPTRQPQPYAKSYVEWKPNISQTAELKYIWRSTLSLNGIKMKIWKERVGTPQKAVHNQTVARGKKKVSLRARLYVCVRDGP
jgi:hypothetical protein